MKQSQHPNTTASQNQKLNRLVKLMLIAVIGVSLLFGGYYFWDRYVHLGDKSPVELNIEHLEQIVQDNPSDPGARLSLAQYYIDHKKYAEGISQAEIVLTAYPENEGALFLLGVAYTKAGENQAAVAPFEKFVALRQENQDALKDMVLEASMFYLGQNYLALNQTEKALEVLASALHIDPTDADAFYLLGKAYAKTGQHELAVEMYENAVRFVPNFLEAYQDMQVSFSALGKTDHETYARGMAAYAASDYAQARQLLELAVQNLSDYPPVDLGLALTYERLGETQLALDRVQRVLNNNPHNFTANNILARLEISNP